MCMSRVNMMVRVDSNFKIIGYFALTPIRL